MAKKATKKTTKKATKKTTKKSATKKAASTKKSTTATAKKTATSTKKTAKKTSRTRASTRSQRQPLPQAAAGQAFWATNGEVMHDLLELRDALTRMENAAFSYHVTTEKNDFADWVERVLEDVACAQALRSARKPATARTVVVRHLKRYDA